MRLTLSWPQAQPIDVDAEPGTTVATLRPHLARLTGHEGWLVENLTVAGRRVDDSHAVGHPPLATGAVLCIGPGSPDPAVEAVRAPWHLAYVGGPSTGHVVGIDGPGRVGGLRVHVRRDAVLVRRRFRRRRWPVGRVLRDGFDQLELRTREQARGEDRSTSSDDERVAPTRVDWLAPLAGAGALAAISRQPAYLLAALVVPLVMAAPRAVRALRRRRAARLPRTGPDELRDVAAVVARSAAAGDAEVQPAVLVAPWGADGSLAVVGARTSAREHARALVVGTVGTHAQVALVLRTRDPAAWTWSRWATDGTRLPGPDDPAALVVADAGTDLALVARWRRGAPPRHRLLLVVENPRDVPAWCTARITPSADAVLSVERAQDQLRRAVALRAAVADSLPDSVPLGELPGIPEPTSSAVAAGWAAAPDSLSPSIAWTAAGPVRLELAQQGPHLLVGGTTGSGKSELLVSLVLACALQQPPERLAVLLVDFKGGTGLGPVAGLPHVVDHVTDLDRAGARRLLVGLGAELRRRERLLAAAGVRDVRELDAAHAPPRLLVVVDELRALVEDVGDAPATLARLAALGRALGVHLVLATQRPAGVVSADLRANVAIRCALRVNDEADSTDLVETAAAAAISPRTPGRALLRTGDGTVRTIQTAQALAARRRAPVHVARPAAAPTGWRPGAPPRAADDDVAAWVTAAVGAAGSRRPDVPWLPALTPVVRASDLVPSGGAGLALALGDEPDRQRRRVVRWDPDEGHLLVLGGPRSGRTTALLTVGAAALRAGRAVHAIGLPAWAAARLASVGGALGTLTGPDEPRVVARLLQLLAGARGGTNPPVLLVDGLEPTLDALGGIARGAGADLLVSIVRAGPVHAAVAAAGDARGPALAHAHAFLDRLVLPLPDTTLDAMVGLPAALSGPRTTPGRAVHLRAPDAVLCQVALPDDARAPDGPRPTTLHALPRSVDLPASRPRLLPGGEAPIGIGGDDARELVVSLERSLLVAGPPGSGRTNTLAVIAAGALAAGRRVVVVSRDGAWPSGTPPRGAWPRGAARLDPANLAAWSPEPATLLVLDDVDDLERAEPDAGERLAHLVHRGGVQVAASSSAGAALGAYRGTLPALVRSHQRLVLEPTDPASADLVGPGCGWLTDHHRCPGRGVLLVGRVRDPVQVYRLPPGFLPDLCPGAVGPVAPG